MEIINALLGGGSFDFITLLIALFQAILEALFGLGG